MSYQSTVLIPKTNDCWGMSSVLQVKMVNEGDDLKIVVPRSYFQRLGLERGDTLLVTVEEERTRQKGRTEGPEFTQFISTTSQTIRTLKGGRRFLRRQFTSCFRLQMGLSQRNKHETRYPALLF